LQVFVVLFFVVQNYSFQRNAEQHKANANNADTQSRADDTKMLLELIADIQEQNQRLIRGIDDLFRRLDEMESNPKSSAPKTTGEPLLLAPAPSSVWSSSMCLDKKSRELLLPEAVPRILQLRNFLQCREEKQTRPITRWHSQESEDKTLFDLYFKDVKRGFFIEIGALDGETFSNTLAYETDLDWGGVLIEAQPSSASALFKRRTNNATLTLAQAICPTPGTLKFSGGASAASGQIDGIRADIKRVYHSGSNNVLYDVNCSPLGPILKATGIPHFNLFSLDVEGAELLVLDTFDWSITVDVWVIEFQESDTKKQQVINLLKSHGYTYRRDVGPNNIFTPNFWDK